MKKLMFAAAAIAAGVAVADISSANVVGYQNRAAEKSGWNLIAGTFKTIGKEKSAMTLADAVGNSL